MSQVFGTLASNDHEEAFIIVQGQELVLQVAQEWIAQRNAEFFATVGVFVEGRTEAFKQRYMRPGAGYMQETGPEGQPAAQKATGSWDVEYPLRNFKIAIGWNDVDIAYMSAEVLSNHIVTGMNSYVNTYRLRILHRLFDNVNDAVTDPIHGSLAPVPLANQDGVLYPPITGEPTDEAQENHYLGSSYTAANISDANNPLVTMVADLDHHTGGPSTGGDNMVTFCNRAQAEQLKALTDFTDVPDNFIVVGDNVDVPVNFPSAIGKTLGRSNGTWIVQWDFIPANYLLTVDIDQPAPLKQRHDLLKTGLGVGDLMLAATDMQHPFTTSFWRARFGIGTGNRLNGVVIFLNSGSSYTVPTAYT